MAYTATTLIRHPDPGQHLDYAEFFQSGGHDLLYPIVRPCSYVVAASDSSNESKAQADSVCDGADDDKEIQAAIDAATTYGGTVTLTEGTFYPTTTIKPKDNVNVIGQGIGVTKFEWDSDTAGTTYCFKAAESGTLEHVMLGRFSMEDTTATPVQSWGVALGGWSNGASVCTDIELFELECKECGLWIANVTSGRAMIRNCYVHDLTDGDRGLGPNWCTNAIMKENAVQTVNEMAIGCSGCTGVSVINNAISDASQSVTSYAIDTAASTSVNVSGNTILSQYGINSEDSAGTVSITANVVTGSSSASGTGIQVWRKATGNDQASKVVISNNIVNTLKTGISVLDESDATILGNKICTVGQDGIKTSCTSGWTAPRYIQIAHNDIFDFADTTAYGTGIRVGAASAGYDYADVLYNNVDGNSNTNARGIQFSHTTGANSRIIGNQIKNVTTKMYGSASTAFASDLTLKDNLGYIGAGEIRTYSGSISTLTENAYNSVDNPFGQNVLVLDETIYISTKATSGAPRLDCGIGSSATTDYVTVFDDITCETVGPYHSVNTATIGKQTSPILWQTGAGNRYFNHSIKAAAATGMVAIYSIRVMGV